MILEEMNKTFMYWIRGAKPCGMSMPFGGTYSKWLCYAFDRDVGYLKIESEI